MTQQKVLLSPIDQLMPTSYIRLFLVVKATLTDHQRAIEQLQRGLTRTQRQLPYIAGTIFETSSGRVGLEWTEESFIQIQVEPIPSDFQSAKHLESADLPFGEVWRLAGSNNHFAHVEITNTLPALRIACSPLDGFLIICVSCFHNVWDTIGLSTFLHLWSRNTKRVGDNEKVPLIEDIVFRDSRLRNALREQKLTQSTSFKTNLEVFDSHDVAELGTHTLRLDVSKLRMLEGQLRLPADQKVTANNLAIAVIWTLISTCRHQSGTRFRNPPRLRVFDDGRRHIFKPPELKTPYLGNLALPVFASLDMQTAAQAIPQTDFVELLTQAVTAMSLASQQASSAAFVEAVITLDETADASTIRESSKAYNAGQLTSTSWSQIPLYADFGPAVGKVEYVRIAPEDYKLEGMILTLPRKWDSSGGSSCLEIFITLAKDELVGLRNSKVIQSLSVDRSEVGSTGRSRAKM